MTAVPQMLLRASGSRLPAAALLLVLAATGAGAQEDAVGTARALAAEARYAEALAVLEAHLADAPGDVDARVIYGLVLSWDERYPDARAEFQQVLAVAPEYTDARMGLANVEWWSGNPDTAAALVDQILTVEPGHPGARLLRQRLDAANRPWSIAIGWDTNRFDDGRATWRSQVVTLGRETPVGPLLLRARRADRFGRIDEQYELEFYPTLRAGTYAAIGLGVSPDHELFPEQRMSVDLYQSLGAGFEVSAGYRRLAFAAVTDIYNASLTRYTGNWMATARVSFVPSIDGTGSTSGSGELRRYFGTTGRSFGAVSYSRGLWREEVRSTGDLLNLDSHTLGGRLSAELSPRFGIDVRGGASRQRAAANHVVWQASVGAGLTVRF